MLDQKRYLTRARLSVKSLCSKRAGLGQQERGGGKTAATPAQLVASLKGAPPGSGG
jgi:hypothetical protein